MADIILVSTSIMRDTVETYNNALNKLDDAYGALDRARQHLDECYRGPGYLALSAKLVAIRANVVTADIAINEAIDGLNKTIESYEAAEKKNTDQSGQMEKGTSGDDFFL